MSVAARGEGVWAVGLPERGPGAPYEPRRRQRGPGRSATATVWRAAEARPNSVNIGFQFRLDRPERDRHRLPIIGWTCAQYCRNGPRHSVEIGPDSWAPIGDSPTEFLETAHIWRCWRLGGESGRMGCELGHCLGKRANAFERIWSIPHRFLPTRRLTFPRSSFVCKSGPAGDVLVLLWQMRANVGRTQSKFGRLRYNFGASLGPIVTETGLNLVNVGKTLPQSAKISLAQNIGRTSAELCQVWRKSVQCWSNSAKTFSKFGCPTAASVPLMCLWPICPCITRIVRLRPVRLGDQVLNHILPSVGPTTGGPKTQPPKQVLQFEVRSKVVPTVERARRQEIPSHTLHRNSELAARPRSFSFGGSSFAKTARVPMCLFRARLGAKSE